jgi:hypothetical protein
LSWPRTGERDNRRRATKMNLGEGRIREVMMFSFSQWEEKPFPVFP